MRRRSPSRGANPPVARRRYLPVGMAAAGCPAFGSAPYCFVRGSGCWPRGPRFHGWNRASFGTASGHFTPFAPDRVAHAGFRAPNFDHAVGIPVGQPGGDPPSARRAKSRALRQAYTRALELSTWAALITDGHSAAPSLAIWLRPPRRATHVRGPLLGQQVNDRSNTNPAMIALVLSAILAAPLAESRELLD